MRKREIALIAGGPSSMTDAREERSRATDLSTTSSLGRRVTWVLIGLLAWLPVQTPLAIVTFQYAHLPLQAVRGILLLKDGAVAILFVALLLLIRSQIRLRWFDYAAIAYVAVVGLYSLLPYVFGSRLPFDAVAASAREFLVPVELYGLGRVAIAAGARVGLIGRSFVAIAAFAAAFTLLLYVLFPASFWSSTMDLVTFERVVQGIPSAKTLWDIAVLGQYGVGDNGSFARAIGPFTHPVGTSHYFLFPLLLAASVAFLAWRRADHRLAAGAGMTSILIAAAVITPISRGTWLAGIVGLVICALFYRKVRISVLVLAVTALFIVTVPPFSYSITSALTRTDSSVIGHESAISHGIDTVTKAPLGLGLGQADQFGQSLTKGAGTAAGTAESAGVGENMYLAILVSVGPLGLVAFMLWTLGLVVDLFPWRQPVAEHWLIVATWAALLGYLGSALTASPLMRFTTGASFWLIAGLAVGSVPPTTLSARIQSLRDAAQAWRRLSAESSRQ